MHKIGEIIGLGSFRSSAGKALNVLDESLPSFTGGEMVTLGGKPFLHAPKPKTFMAQAAFDWLAEQHLKLIGLVGKSWPPASNLNCLRRATK